MSTYKELVKKANEVEDIIVRGTKSEPVLKARLVALRSSQDADVQEAQATLHEAEINVNLARGMVTTSGRDWLANLDLYKNIRDEAAEDLKVSQDRLDEIKEELKIFS